MSRLPPESKPDDVSPSVAPVIKEMIARAEKRGIVTYEEINAAMPHDLHSSEQIEDIMSQLSEMGVNVVEDESSVEHEPHSYENGAASGKNVTVSDLIIGGNCIRIARLPYDKEVYWLLRGGGGTAARLLNRLARQMASEACVGFRPGGRALLLNHGEEELLLPEESSAEHLTNHRIEKHFVLLTEAGNWWAEQVLSNEYDPNLLTFRSEVHILPDTEQQTLLVPYYEKDRIAFSCPPATDYPDTWEENNTLFVVNDDKVERIELGRSEATCDVIYDFGDSSTKIFKRALQSLFAELAVHGVYGVDHGRDNLVMRETWSEIDVPLWFYLENGLSLYDDVPIVAIDTITWARTQSDIGKYSAVKWDDFYELCRRVSHPELSLMTEMTSDTLFFIARTDERAEETIRLCEKLAPRCGLKVNWGGNVNTAATVGLIDTVPTQGDEPLS